MKKLTTLFAALVALLALSTLAFAEAAPAGSTMAKKSVVVYFSATGNTDAVAKHLAEGLGADAIELQPAEPYTAADLNYSDSNCRANREMQDAAARPALSGDYSAVLGYDTIYLGYPIWWGTAPRIIRTFLDSYDLSGKRVYLFCTSGSSGVATSMQEIHTAYPNINIVKGNRFTARTSASDLAAWAE